MKKIHFAATHILLLTVMLVSCLKVSPIKNNNDVTVMNDISLGNGDSPSYAGKEKLTEIYTFSKAPHLSTHQSTAIIQSKVGLHQADTPDKYILLNFKDRIARFTSDYPLLFDISLAFFTDEFVFGLDFGNEVSVAYRSKYDNSGMSKIVIPSGWDFRTGQIISNDEQNLYVVIEGVDDTNRGECSLVRLDFNDESFKVLLYSESADDGFRIMGVYNNDLVLSVYPSFIDGIPSGGPLKNEDRIMKLFSVTDNKSELVDISIDWHDIPQYVDPYTGIHYVSAGAEQIQLINYQTNDSKTIRYEAPDDIDSMWLVPITSTEDFFILQTGAININGNSIPEYSMIKKSDYQSGNLDLISINYNDICDVLS